MIESLRIRELALVDELELAFADGLNVLTGETGAGKSIVLGALALLAGARARPDDVRDGAEQAELEAVFGTEGLPELEAELAERGLEVEQHEVIVRRTVARGGRSRAWIGGRAVPIGVLAEVFGGRLEISSQHESQGLLRATEQGRALDAFGGLIALRRTVAQGVARLRAREEEIAALRTESEERTRREDFLAFQVKEIDEAGLEPGESDRLAEEHARLVHAERLREESAGAAHALVGDPSAPEAPGALDLAARAARTVAALGELDPRLAPLATRLDALHTEAIELASDLERYASAIEGDPARLFDVEERIALLERLRRKYGDDADAILAFRDRAAAQLAETRGADERLAKLEVERAADHALVAEAANKLTRARKRAAKALGVAVQDALRALSMPEAAFEVALEPAEPVAGAPCGATGAEVARFRLSANPGETPRDLRQVASGGELSRTFLALKNVLRASQDARPGMVLVFDEVDAGVGGAVADRVGGVLAAIARDHQVLCITHLPQIAARAGHHLHVAKHKAGGRTVTRVEALDGAARIDEIARMAGGEKVTAATRRHAEALLAAARD